MSELGKIGLPPLNVVAGDARGAALSLLRERGMVPPEQGGGPMAALPRQVGDGPPGSMPAPPHVHLSGGKVLQDVKHPIFRTVEELYRVLPEEGFFDLELSPSRPFKFPLGAFRVPKNQQLWMTDYSFAVLRLSGVDASDFVYAEAGRFSGVMGFDVTINDRRLSELRYQLDPQPLSLTREQFQRPKEAPPGPDVAPPDVFNRAAAQSFASAAGVGSSLLPVRPFVQGPREGPFTWIADENDYVALSCVIFRPLRSPIAAVEGRMAGFLLHTNLSEALLRRMRPI